MKFFLDNNLPLRAAQVLNLLYQGEGHEVAHLTEIFEEDADDTDWLHQLGEQGDWVVITLDRRISRNRRERQVWSRSGLRVFFLTGKGWQLPFKDLCKHLIAQWDDIVQLADKKDWKTGLGYLVPLTGKIRAMDLATGKPRKS